MNLAAQLAQSDTDLARACEAMSAATLQFEAAPTDANLEALERAERGAKAAHILQVKAQREHEAEATAAATRDHAARLAECRAACVKANYRATIEPKRAEIVNRMASTWDTLRDQFAELVALEHNYHGDLYAALELCKSLGVEPELEREGGIGPDGRPTGNVTKFIPSKGALWESLRGSPNGNGPFYRAFRAEFGL